MNNRHQLAGEVLLPQNIMEMVARYGKRIGVPKLARKTMKQFVKIVT